MNVARILKESGRIKLADLAGLLLPVSIAGREKDGDKDDDFGEVKH
jgi:hypothetical protein